MKKQHKKRRTRKIKRNMPEYHTKLHITSVILKVYLVPFAKICLFLWLIVTGKIIDACAIYLLFGLSKLYNTIKNEIAMDNWILNILICVFLWPAIDIYTFIPPRDSDLEK